MNAHRIAAGSPHARRRSSRRRRTAAGAIAAAAVVLAGCSTDAGTASTVPGGAQSHTIAISFPNASAAPVVQNLFRIAQAEAKAKGYKLVIDDPGADAGKQVSTIQTWIQQGVGAIVASTLDPMVVDSVAKQAQAAGIKWVTFATTIPHQDATLGFPHEEAGLKLGTAAGTWITARLGGSAKVGLLAYSPAQYARERAKGILAGLKQTAPQAQVVATQDAVSSTDGLAKVSAMLQAHPDLDVVLAVEDSAGQGAYQAFLDSGHSSTDPKVFIGGINGAQDQLKLVQQGTIYRATAAFNQRLLGQGFVTLPDNLLHGKKGDLYTPVELVEHGSPSLPQFLSFYGS